MLIIVGAKISLYNCVSLSRFLVLPSALVRYELCVLPFIYSPGGIVGQ